MYGCRCSKGQEGGGRGGTRERKYIPASQRLRQGSLRDFHLRQRTLRADLDFADMDRRAVEEMKEVEQCSKARIDIHSLLSSSSR